MRYALFRANNTCLPYQSTRYATREIIEQFMELLIVTLAYTNPDREADVLARMRLISDMVRNAPGMMGSQFYRGQGNGAYYILLTTWDSEEGWRRAKERYSPRFLLLNSALDLLTAVPEQWLMQYLWGYSRPTAPLALAAVQIVEVPITQTAVTQKAWIEGLRRQAAEPTLANAFLAYGGPEETTPSPSMPPAQSPEAASTHVQPTTIFLNILNWANEYSRDFFYANNDYQALQRFISSVGTVQNMYLEPI